MKSLLRPSTTSALCLVIAAALGGCGGGEDAGTGDEDNLTQTVACTVVDARTGKKLSKSAIAKLSDPVATALLKSGGTCPKTFQAIQAKLAETDKAGCENDQSGGVQTRFVSERAQVLGKPDSYRAVVTRTCGGRQPFGLMLSLFGIQFDGDKPPAALPDDVEIIGFDATAKVFNYYTVEGGKWSFFGDSRDMIQEGAGEKTRCANCHTGGGPIMKELNSPWVHWEGDTDTPGAAELMAAFPQLLGKKSTGIELEQTVVSGNREWNATRVKELQGSGTVAGLLRPLFCTVEINTQSQLSAPSRAPADFLFDPSHGKFDSLPFDNAAYLAQLATNNQRVVDGGGEQLRNAEGKGVVDTFFGFSYPERSGADKNMVDQLKGAGIIDDDFIRDVLMVDFTRPIFSDARCGLLPFAPELDAAGRTPAAIRDGFVANLEQASGDAAAAELLASLKSVGDAKAHDDRLASFVAACKARPASDLLADILVVTSARREVARGLQIMEFAESMPIDDLGASPSSALDPVTCALMK